VIHFTDKWTKISVDIEICLGNNQRNFQLHRFTRRENTEKSVRAATFLTHTVDLYKKFTNFSLKFLTKFLV